MRNPHSDINDLVTLDPELYRNLMFLRDYDGDFADLALTFTTADNDVGQSREVRYMLISGSCLGASLTTQPRCSTLLCISPLMPITLPLEVSAPPCFWPFFLLLSCC